jgi:hypothetical protein
LIGYAPHVPHDSTRLHRELEEELESHIEEAISSGRDPIEARRPPGSLLRHRDASRDAKLLNGVDSLRATRFSAGASSTKPRSTHPRQSFRWLSPSAPAPPPSASSTLFPAPAPGRRNRPPLRTISRRTQLRGQPGKFDSNELLLFKLMRAVVKDLAELFAISSVEPRDLTHKSDQGIEKACVQCVSGWAFSAFLLRPALGRTFSEADDLEPGIRPYAVLS